MCARPCDAHLPTPDCFFWPIEPCDVQLGVLRVIPQLHYLAYPGDLAIQTNMHMVKGEHQAESISVLLQVKHAPPALQTCPRRPACAA